MRGQGWVSWRGAAGRNRLIACCRFGAGECGARESFCGVLRVSDAASEGGECCSRKCLGLVLGYRRLGAGCCGCECWSWAGDEGSVDNGVIEAGSGREACVSRTGQCLNDRGCSRLRYGANGEET
jgi:hypothetical protein